MIDWDAVVLGPLEAVFGETGPATYMPRAGASYDLAGVFDNGHVAIGLLDQASPASTVKPVFGVRLVNMRSPPAKGDRVLIQSTGVVYTVEDLQPDGHGWAKLVLGKSARQQ
ncbi:MAG TPA: hypothetical protein VG248_17270 [Caulobacteraceae bacterium]|jgi:hypothetical protein|nr:hypothetical protein [Caulobacteraceae bacterium]